jgi:hypothetical protein
MSMPSCALAFAGDRRVVEVIDAVRAATPLLAADASLWVWVRGGYEGGSLSLKPWKTVVGLVDGHAWRVRNEVVWACRAADPVPESRLKRGHENIYHLSRTMGYYYDRTMGSGFVGTPGRNRFGCVRTSSGVVGSRYAVQIERTASLNDDERMAARKALGATIEAMRGGSVSDFRMYLRGVHRVSGRVAEAVSRDGFHVRISGPRSVVIDDTWTAFASETNARVPPNVVLSLLRLSCPPDGAVLDVFPTPEVARVVTASGRTYVANGVEIAGDGAGGVFGVDSTGEEHEAGNKEGQERVEITAQQGG